MTGQFFRFYHREVLRAVQRTSSSLRDSEQAIVDLELKEEAPQALEQCHHRDIIASYIEAVKSIADSSSRSEDEPNQQVLTSMKT